MSLPPPTQRGRRPPPALVDDAMREIFLRVPPDEPASLVRAAAVCKGWGAILLSDASFVRDYRVLHGPTPPMLGFLHNRPYGTRSGVSRFVPTPHRRALPPAGMPRPPPLVRPRLPPRPRPLLHPEIRGGLGRLRPHHPTTAG